MEKQACHMEWGRLKVTGRPVMTGGATGSSRLMRVACRTSPCLVHLFEDTNLVSIWRFPADPVFLLFGPSFHQIHVEDMAEDSKSSECSLLVVTSDGRVWILDCWREDDPSGERFIKKKKEAVPEELQKAVQEILVDGSDARPLDVQRYSQPKQWDDLEDVDTLGSQMPEQLVRDGGPLGRAECYSNKVEDCHATLAPDTKSINHTSISSRLVDLDSKWNKVSSEEFPRFDSKLKVKMVSEEALLSCVPGTLVAAFGPNNSVALLDVSGTLKLIQVGCSDVLRSTSTKTDEVNDPSTDNRESSCLLYASVISQCDSDEQPDGYVALLEATFFQNLFGCADNITSPIGILHGDMKGHLYTSLISPELELFHTRHLCDFGQPTLAAFAVPATAGKDKLISEEDSTSTKHHSSSLLVIGKFGKVVLIAGMKEAVAQADDGLFWPTTRRFSWISSNNTLTSRQLNERNLEFCEWEVFSPITFACMLGPHRLCYCTRSEIYYADLFDNVDVGQIYPHNSKTKVSTRTEPKDSVSLSLLKLSQRLQSSVSQEFKEKPMFKKELLSQKVPLVDVVVAIAGRGVRGGDRSSRPLVALTTRGRLLGVEVSNHVSSRALSIEGDFPRSWRSLLSRMEEKIQGLLQVVGEVEKSTNIIKTHSATITLCLNELASALPMAKAICLYEMGTRRPDTSLIGEPPPGKLSSFLTVTDHTSVYISPENLSFGPGTVKHLLNTGFRSRKVKIAVRVCNHSRLILSPYWSLLLELRSVTCDKSVHLSVPVNGGLGLPVGAEYTHEFIAHLPGEGLGPVLIDVFLCHHDNPHHLIAESQPSGVSSCPQRDKKVLRSSLLDSSSSKVGTIFPSAAADKTKVSESSQTAGAVCIVLSQYRVDLLSLLQGTPQHLGIDTRVLLNSADKHANSDASSVHDGHFLGKFSSKIWSSVMNTQYTASDNTEKLWQDLYLDDLLRRGSMSKAGDKICVSAYDAETFSISIKSGPAGEKRNLVEVTLESSSLLLGSYVREALMWRLDQCKERFIGKGCCPRQLTKTAKSVPSSGCHDDMMINGAEDCQTQSRPTKVIDMVAELDERLGRISVVWGSVLRCPERVQFSSLLNETYIAIQDVMRAYRTCREEEPYRSVNT